MSRGRTGLLQRERACMRANLGQRRRVAATSRLSGVAVEQATDGSTTLVAQDTQECRVRASEHVNL